VSVFVVVQLKSPASMSSVGACGIKWVMLVLKKSSLSLFRAVPDGA
jgi:hypothetical protein